MKRENLEIRQAALDAKVPLWAIADRLGRTDTWMSRKLRKPLTSEETAQYLEIIETIAKAEEGA